MRLNGLHFRLGISGDKTILLTYCHVCSCHLFATCKTSSYLQTLTMAFPVSNWSEATAVFGFSRTVGYSPEQRSYFWLFSAAAAAHIQRGITTFCIPKPDEK